MRRAGCSHAEIGAITGHSNAEINAIIERHCAATDPKLAISAMRKYDAMWGGIPKAIPKSGDPVQEEPSWVEAISEKDQEAMQAS